MTNTQKNYTRRASKKQGDEHLQEIRNHTHNRIRYLKRVQEEEELERYLKDELQRLSDEDE